MGSERNHVAAEEVNTADNLLKANLHFSNHTSINVPPLRKIEVLQLLINCRTLIFLKGGTFIDM